jgi:hypothetical protein
MLGKAVATARLGNVLAGLVASNSTVTAMAASAVTPSRNQPERSC